MSLQERLTVAALGLVLLAGCRATYPKGTEVEAITRICQREYKAEVQVKSAGRTLGALIPVRRFLDDELAISDSELKKVMNIMQATARVALSSEWPDRFFTVALFDPVTGVQVNFVAYLKDYRRLIVDDISISDYWQRMLIEVHQHPAGAYPLMPADWLPDYTLGDFIARQIASRVKAKFQQNLVVDKLFHLLGIEGEYISQPDAVSKEGSGILRLVVHFQNPPQRGDAFFQPSLRERLNQLLLETARTTVRHYEFDGYQGLEIVDGQGKLLAYFQREVFQKEGLNRLLDLINTFKNK